MKDGELIQLCAGRYYQGRGVLFRLGEEAALLGNKALVVADAGIWPQVEERILHRLSNAGVDFVVWLFSGRCCPANYSEAVVTGMARSVGLVVGVGGGGACDTAKIAADKLGVRAVMVPTSAATCAACAWLSVEYTDQGGFVGNYWTQYPPAAVVAELEFLAEGCPPRYFAAGIVDAMAKLPEVSYNIYYPARWKKNLFSHCAKELAGETYQLLLEHGEEALALMGSGKDDSLLEDCLCACLQVTGLISAMACGGKQAAISHTLYSYFCNFHPQIVQQFLHGEMVGSSLVYQLAANGAPREEQLHLEDFLRRLKVPCCLQELGLTYSSALSHELFSFLETRMPVTSSQELARLRRLEDILFYGTAQGS